MTQGTATKADLSDRAYRLAWEGTPKEICDELGGFAGSHVTIRREVLDLVAGHNLQSPAARAIQARIGDMTQSGNVGARLNAGTQWIDNIEIVATELAKRLFRAKYAELRPMTGSLANAVVILSALRPGQRVMVSEGRHGGHKTYLRDGYARHMAIDYVPVPHNEIDGEGELNLQQTIDGIIKHRPHWIFLGSSRVLFAEPLRELQAAAQSVGANILYDAAHTLGLIAGGQFKDPMTDGVAVMTGSSQKTLGGPVGGLVLSNDPEVSRAIASTSDTLISNYSNYRLGGLAITLAETLQFGEAYAKNVIANARALGDALCTNGVRVVRGVQGCTQSHIILLNLKTEVAAKQAMTELERAGIASTLLAISSSYPSMTAIRLGTTMVTRLGMGLDEMKTAAQLIRRVLVDRERPETVRSDVLELVAGFRDVRYCFSDQTSMGRVVQ
jgi:glycine hydroxymethyltransferase